jgi:hypothetical protein
MILSKKTTAAVGTTIIESYQAALIVKDDHFKIQDIKT